MEPPVRRLAAAFNVTNMHAEPDARAEVVSQALFGENAVQLDQHDGWARIQTPDGYSGWARADRFAALPADRVYPETAWSAVVTALFAPVTTDPRVGARGLTLLTLGCAVERSGPDAGAFTPIRLPDGTAAHVSAADVAPHLPRPPGSQVLVNVARRFAGVPYLWGGRSPFGIDCSGFTQRVFGLCGIVLPRDAYAQARSPLVTPADADSLQPGDLLFFLGDADPRGRGITHVGLYTGEGRFIHAQGALGVVEMPLATPPYPRQLVQAGRVTL